MEKEEKLRNMGSTALAFVGDAVFSLFVREKLTMACDFKSGQLTQMASKLVSAAHQANIVEKILPHLSEEESDIVRRARNTKTNNKAKNASFSIYHKATSLEALIGYLYLSGGLDRLYALIEEPVMTECQDLLQKEKAKRT